MLAKSLLLAGALAIGLASAPTAFAAQPLREAGAGEAVFHNAFTPVEQNLISPMQAIQNARRAFGGEPMGTPSLEGGGRPVYLIRWRFPNEVVDFIRVDAVTGQVMR
jgi:uncharacterized membrane protein YkoI